MHTYTQTDRHRQTDRQNDRQTDRERETTDRQTDRQRETDREPVHHKHNHTYKPAKSHTHIPTLHTELHDIAFQYLSYSHPLDYINNIMQVTTTTLCYIHHTNHIHQIH